MNIGKKKARTFVAFPVGVVLALSVPEVARADIGISDARVTEGDAATTMTFVVTRPAALAAGEADVYFTTRDGSALAPGDYVSKQGHVHFPPQVLAAQAQVIQITIAGDQVAENPEAFSVVLTRVSGGEQIVRGTATGSILDNDPVVQPPAGRNYSTTTVDQQLISKAADGGFPNAPIEEPTISRDSRIARYVAYSSRATNIAGAADGHRNVYLVKRGGSAGALGTAWGYGSTALASPGRGGAAANGDSFGPSLGGWTKGDTAKKPTCLGYVSRASNLVAGDGNGRADGFVRKLAGGKTVRIQGPGAVSEIAVSGDCKTIAVVAGGSLFAKRGKKKLRKIAKRGVSSPDLTFNGLQISYSQNGKIRVRRSGGGAVRGVANGANPSSDDGRPAGKIRMVAYQRGNAAFISSVSGGEKLMSFGSLPTMSAGGTQAMFAYGPYAYLYAVSNSFGKAKPQGFCPSGQGVINGLTLSSRGNYAVLTCTGGPAYLSFLGGK